MDSFRAKIDELPDEVKRLILAAEVEAKSKNHFFIGTEHLLNPLINHPKISRAIRESSPKALESLKRLSNLISYPKLKGSAQSLTLTPAMMELLRRVSQVKPRTPEELLIELLSLSVPNNATELLRLAGVSLEELKAKLRAAPAAKYKLPPLLAKLGRNLNQLAEEGKLSPVIGRDEEMARLIQVLLRKTKNNPVLIGEPGVGKTAIVEGLAQRIVRGDVPPQLRSAIIIELSTSMIVAGTKYRGEFEERLNKVIQEASSNPDIILFIDEIHTIMGAGDSGGGMNAANILKPAIARGEIKLIGATTVDEYYRFISKDPALERRFEPILVDEPTYEEALEILRGVAPKYEEHHKVRYTPEALVAAVKLSMRYITDRHLPDKAIDLIDEAAAQVRLENPDEERPEVREEHIARVVSTRTGIPVGKLRQDERERIARLEEELRRYIVGQDEAIEKVAKVIKISRAGLTTTKRPYGVFLFLGPTGVGKTYFAKILAKLLFDSEERLFRLDMSEFKEKHEVSKLLGAPPGYVGYEQEGLLTKALKTHPYCIILLDEIEKAHPEVFDIFLQVFDEGRLKDAKGRNLSFTDTVIIMTSNIGSQLIMNALKSAGGDPDKIPIDELKEAIIGEALKFFRPELLNRIDEIVVFKPLSREAVKGIVRMQLEELTAKLREQDIQLQLTDEALELIIKEGYSLEFGARNIRRAIQRLIISPLAQKILDGEVQPHSLVLIEAVDGELHFSVQRDDSQGSVSDEDDMNLTKAD